MCLRLRVRAWALLPAVAIPYWPLLGIIVIFDADEQRTARTVREADAVRCELTKVGGRAVLARHEVPFDLSLRLVATLRILAKDVLETLTLP